jgi:PAS domain S-box-containing protein
MELPRALEAVVALLAGGMITWFWHHLRTRRRSGTSDPKHQKELEIQRAFLDQLFENSPEAIALLDPHDRVVRVNTAFTRMFGYTGPEAAGRPINDLLVPDDLRGEAQALSDKVERGQQVSKESVRRRKDGTRLNVSLLGSPILMTDGQIGIYAIYRDITQHLKTELALQQAQKLESLESSPAASPMTSTTCWSASSATPRSPCGCCPRRCPLDSPSSRSRWQASERRIWRDRCSPTPVRDGSFSSVSI